MVYRRGNARSEGAIYLGFMGFFVTQIEKASLLFFLGREKETVFQKLVRRRRRKWVESALDVGSLEASNSDIIRLFILCHIHV